MLVHMHACTHACLYTCMQVPGLATNLRRAMLLLQHRDPGAARAGSWPTRRQRPKPNVLRRRERGRASAAEEERGRREERARAPPARTSLQPGEGSRCAPTRAGKAFRVAHCTSGGACCERLPLGCGCAQRSRLDCSSEDRARRPHTYPIAHIPHCMCLRSPIVFQIFGGG